MISDSQSEACGGTSARYNQDNLEDRIGDLQDIKIQKEYDELLQPFELTALDDENRNRGLVLSQKDLVRDYLALGLDSSISAEDSEEERQADFEWNQTVESQIK